jgi:triacylglycerol esterase/lipase EstA (alpha/beta hydrolase family)
VLIGHGYGGLVIKNLISQTYNIKQRDKEWRKAYNFLQKVRGIVFFSVPHSTVEGTREFEHYIMESSKSRVLRRSGLLKWLKNDMEAFSRQMKQLSVDFEARVPKRTVILSFVEGKGKVSKLLLGI